MQKITPFLWFDDNAEEAANFYVEVFGKIFKDSKILNLARYQEAAEEVSGKQAGSIMTISFLIGGETFTAINGGPNLQFSGAVSFVVSCETQDEIDYFWEKLGEGGETGQCGWINKDKFGVTWQIVPTVLEKLMSDPDKQKSNRAMEALIKMEKLDIGELTRAFEGR